MTTDYNKKRHLELLDERSRGDTSNKDELLRYSVMLSDQLDWEIRDQYVSLMENFVNGTIGMYEFLHELQRINYSVMDASLLLQKHKILLSVDKRASKFADLLEYVTSELQVDPSSSYTAEEFQNMIQEFLIPMKTYLNEVCWNEENEDSGIQEGLEGG